MELTSWRGTVVRRGDVTVAKNYLNGPEITELNRIVTMFLDFAEDQAERRKPVFMRDWRAKLDDFLRFNERAVLPDAGHVTREEADRKAEQEFDLFEQRRRAEIETEAEAELLGRVESLAKRAGKGRKPKKKK